MNNKIEIPVRVFPVTTRDERTGALEDGTIVLTKQQLNAAQIVGQSSTELIRRIYNRQGFRVLEIRKPFKKTVQVDLFFSMRTGSVIAEGETVVIPMAAEEGGEEV